MPVFVSAVFIHVAEDVLAQKRTDMRNVNNFEFLVGKWRGTRDVLQRDGSRLVQQVEADAYFVYNGQGFHDDWYIVGDDGKMYWGTTVRSFKDGEGFWKNLFYTYRGDDMGWDWGNPFRIEFRDGVFFRYLPEGGDRNTVDRVSVYSDPAANSEVLYWIVDRSTDGGQTWIERVVIMKLQKH